MKILEEKNIDQLIRSYYKYVFAKAKLYLNPNNPLSMDKKNKKDYFSKKETDRILSEIETLNQLSAMAFEVK